MLNKIVCDKDLNVELVINIQAPRTFDDTWDNSIIISIDADDTANQSLYVNAEQATATYLITPSQINEIEIETEYWNMGGASTITLRKGSTDYGTITINFPDEIDSLGMLNRDENIETTFTMTGSFNDPSDIATKVEEKQDKLVAGSGISIEGNVISATGGGGGGGINYSTEEQDTGLTWIDGRKVYQMTVELEFTRTASANVTYINYVIQNLYRIINITGIVRDRRSVEFSFPYARNGVTMEAFYEHTSGSTISFYNTFNTGNGQTSYIIATILYTKTS